MRAGWCDYRENRVKSRGALTRCVVVAREDGSRGARLQRGAPATS
jgi:hypothetical protein